VQSINSACSSPFMDLRQINKPESVSKKVLSLCSFSVR